MFAGLKREDAAFALAFDGIKSKLEIEDLLELKRDIREQEKAITLLRRLCYDEN